MAIAQDLPAPVHVRFVEGGALLERDSHEQPPIANAPFVAGNRLTTTTGRVEVVFPGGTALDVDEDSALDRKSPTLMRPGSGRTMLNVPPGMAVPKVARAPLASADNFEAGAAPPAGRSQGAAARRP